MWDKFLSIAGSVISAIIGSICCIGPIVAGAVGLGSGAFFLKFEPYRPLFIAIALLAIGFGFYSIYFKRPKVKCDDGECRVEVPSKFSKISLWLTTVIVLSIIFFPYLSSPGITDAVQNDGNSKRAVLKIDGLDCEACIVSINYFLREESGVKILNADFEGGKLYIEFKPDSISLDKIADVINRIGFKVVGVKTLENKEDEK
jgi:mercuric ion transport protein